MSTVPTLPPPSSPQPPAAPPPISHFTHLPQTRPPHPLLPAASANMQQIGGSAACTIVSNNCTSAGGYGRYNETYSYDPLGNLDVKAGVDLDYNTSRPHAVTHFNNTQRYWYDANGNMETRLDGSVTWNYDWTIDNKLREADNGTTTVTFTYDADGNMVLRDDNGTSTVYLGKLYQHKVSNNTRWQHYVFNGQLVVWRQTTGQGVSTTRLFLTDHLGGTSTALTSIGALASDVRYGPWGNERWANGVLPTEYRYTGQRADTTLGIYDYRARYYDPSIGRFLSADTIVPNPGNPQAFNRYSYANNSPVKYSDPSGHKPCDFVCPGDIIYEGSWTGSDYYGEWNTAEQAENRDKLESFANGFLQLVCGFFDYCDFGYTGARVATGQAGTLETIALGAPIVPGIVGRWGDELLEFAGRYGDEVLSVLRAADEVLPIGARGAGGTGRQYNRVTGSGLYVLLDNAGNVVYVGRGDAPARLLDHGRNALRRDYQGFIVANNNLSYEEARGLEQLIIDYYGGTGNLLNNYNGISPSNPRRTEYLQSGLPLLQEALDLIAGQQ